jgi:phospholipid/cholesterol/gamma-HCH transport system ATP-binding protein
VTDARGPIIEVKGVEIGWGSRVLMRELEFEVARGEVFVILGGSGCGKSTLQRHLIGLERPRAGTILFEGRPPALEPDAPPAYGVMFQSGALLGSLTVGQNVALPLRSWTRLDEDAIDTVVRAKLALVGLGGFENHLPNEISGGMKKRAAIARAMALDPALLYLDEPSAGLDPVSAAELDDLIITLTRGLGVTVVIVTHELASIFAIGTRCIMLDRDAKGIIARGDPRVLRDTSEDPRVRRFFNRETTAASEART